MTSSLVMVTSLGKITLRLRNDVAPVTAAHVAKLAASSLYHDTSFYRSDFVIQCGTHGTRKTNPHPALTINESKSPGALSNKRGTASVAHWDVPDCGNSEWFINLKDSPHLDTAYGGYCVFAEVAASDAASWGVIDAIAAAVKNGQKPAILEAQVV